ncbi:sensor domain-containing diguanylate cyclase [Yoonia sediminilitoris]|uniref:sensor domain-containing diguanylate cyclase n=1 Tax=Yoonia sediminilitoris TaxID=1286148 RepID=UPI001FE96ACE|nr:sensor domain-containing diguanylate cyclase [Yoonia sediminilitoris]
MLNTYARWCYRILSGQRCAIAFKNDDDEIIFHSSHGEKGTAQGERFPLAGSAAGYVIDQRQTVYVPDLSKAGTKGCVMLHNLGYRSLAMSPLATHGKCFGVITVGYRDRPDRNSDEFQILEVMGQCLAQQLLISEQIAELSEQATSDALTGVRNRHFLDTAAKEVWTDWRENNTAFGFVSLDIDHFKEVNDKHGHLIGDQVLKVFTQRLNSRLRQSDILTRLGGEEFAVLARGTRMTDLPDVGRRLIKAIRSAPFKIGNQRFDVTASFGVAGPTESDASIKDVFKRADDALYAAKRAGRNRIFHAANGTLSEIETDLV